MTRPIVPIALAAAALLGSAAARAADIAPSFGDPGAAAPGYVVTLGGGAEFGPRFLGARRYGFTPVPSFDIRKADEPAGFSSPQDDLDYAFVDTGRFSAGPVAALRLGRRRADMPQAMDGLDATPTVLELGGFAEYWLAPDALRTRVEVRHGVRSNDGVVADLSADLVRRAGAVTLSGGPRLTAAGGDVMDRNFGVSPGEAAANARVGAFRAESGVQSAGVGGALRYAATPVDAFSLYGRYDRLLGDAAKSPITRSFGSPNQATVGLTYERSFSFGQ